MEKKIKNQPPIASPEKHPLEDLPVQLVTIIAEEELDSIPYDETEETPPFEPPVEGEGP